MEVAVDDDADAAGSDGEDADDACATPCIVWELNIVPAAPLPVTAAVPPQPLLLLLLLLPPPPPAVGISVGGKMEACNGVDVLRTVP